MGLRMDDIHAPTVQSGPTSNGVSSSDDAGRKSLVELMDARDKVQSELFALGSVLESHGVNMQTSLLTLDGYPRSDIDVAQIRTTRARIVRLKNDYKWLMERIEKGLHEHHANLAAAGKDSAPNGVQASAQRAAPANTPGTSATVATQIQAPFCRVNSVAHSSPAEASGLKVGDKITMFGYVNFTNHERLSKVAQVVQANEGREILLKVLREDTAGGPGVPVELKLTPRHNWGGRGMLGCHLLPL